MEVEETSHIVIGAAIRIHRAFGPGLLETAYETILERELIRLGLQVERQKIVNLRFGDLLIERMFVIDLLVNDHLILELKATEKISPVHSRQLMTYLRFTGITMGLVINFGQPTLKEGLHRILNGHPTPSSVLQNFA